MSNGHVGTNSVVATVSNGIPFLLQEPLHYVNPFFLKNGTIFKINVTVFATTVAVVGSNNLGLVINGCYSGFQRETQRE